jgi:Zn-dependent protease with chaperone function
MISALSKISQDSTIEQIKKTTVSAMCIATPFAKGNSRKSKFGSFFSSHPSIENRIEMLQKY